MRFRMIRTLSEWSFEVFNAVFDNFRTVSRSDVFPYVVPKNQSKTIEQAQLHPGKPGYYQIRRMYLSHTLKAWCAFDDFDKKSNTIGCSRMSPNQSKFVVEIIAVFFAKNSAVNGISQGVYLYVTSAIRTCFDTILFPACGHVPNREKGYFGNNYKNIVEYALNEIKIK